VMQDECHELVVELKALQNSASRVWDLLLKGSDETSSLVVSLSTAVDLIEHRVIAAAANGTYWGARLVLTTTLWHFPELELLGFGHKRDLTEGQLEAFLA
jgi:hypothetical protein